MNPTQLRPLTYHVPSTRKTFFTKSISPSKTTKDQLTSPTMPSPLLLPPGPQQTLLATLHARALDTTRHPHPLLNDTHAVETLRKLVSSQSDHEITTNTGMTLPESAGICLRSLALDAWTSSDDTPTNQSRSCISRAVWTPAASALRTGRGYGGWMWIWRRWLSFGGR